MSYCTYCGTQNREGALFCKKCGKPMSEPQEDNYVEQPVEEQTAVEAQPIVETPPVVETQITAQPVAAAPSIVEIPIETPMAAPQNVEMPPVAPPVVPQATPQRAPQAVPPAAPKAELHQTPSDLMERVSKPRNKGKITIILLIPLFLALIGIGVGAFFLFHAANKIKDEVHDTVEAVNNGNDESYDNAVVNEDNSAQEDTEEAGATEETEAAEETVEDDNTADYMTETKASGSASLSTKAKPKVADFQGWFVDGAMKAGKPNGVKTLSSLSDISGSWKAFLFLDPTNRNGEKAQTFGTVTFDGTNERIKVYLKRYYTHFFNDNENMDESSEAPDFFSARWKAGQLIASGVGSFIITDFWEQDGKQYAIGTFSTQDGITASMGLVRP